MWAVIPAGLLHCCTSLRCMMTNDLVLCAIRSGLTVALLRLLIISKCLHRTGLPVSSQTAHVSLSKEDTYNVTGEMHKIRRPINNLATKEVFMIAQDPAPIRLAAHAAPLLQHDFQAQPMCQVTVQLSFCNCLQSPATLCIETGAQMEQQQQQSGEMICRNDALQTMNMVP